MQGRIGSDTAAAIVQTDTIALINKADDIVRACTGTNCNTSSATRTAITEQLSTLAQNQAASTQRFLSVPSNSVVGRNIYEGYLNLGAAVASVYNFQCGNSTVNSLTCVTNATSVRNAQVNLEAVLLQPAQNEGSHIVVLSFLITLVLFAFFLFFIFFSIGLIGSIVEIPVVAATTSVQVAPVPITHVAPVAPNPVPITHVAPNPVPITMV